MINTYEKTHSLVCQIEKNVSYLELANLARFIDSSLSPQIEDIKQVLCENGDIYLQGDLFFDNHSFLFQEIDKLVPIFFDIKDDEYYWKKEEAINMNIKSLKEVYDFKQKRFLK